MTRYKYLILQIKNAYIYMLKGLLVLAALFVVAIGICYGSYKFLTSNPSEDSENLSIINIGVVSEGDDYAIEYLLTMVEDIEGVKGLCNITSMDEYSAYSGLEEGSLRMIIYIPEDFYIKASGMEDTSVTIIMAQPPSKLEYKFLGLIGAVEDLMSTTEGAIRSCYDGMYNMNIPITKGKMEADLFLGVIDEFLGRDKLFQFEFVSLFGSFSAKQFLICSFVTIFMLLMGTFFIGLYRHEEIQLERLVYRGKLSILWGTLGHIISMTVALGTIVSAIIALLFFWVGENQARAYGALWLIALSVSILIHLIISVLGDNSHAAVIYVLFVFLLILVSGVVVPAVYLPGVLRNIAIYLPGGSYQQVLLDAFWSKRRLNGMDLLLITDVLLLLISVIMYGRRLAKHD